jgi:ureidoglycolate hydrolase
MNPNENLIEIKEYTDKGYQPLINYEEWRVAILKYCDELLPENITKMQKHNQTDEVFVLLEGECILLLAEGEEEITEIHAQRMEPLKVYNVKRSVWHSHTLSDDAVVLIIENDDTCLDNSPEQELSTKQQEKLVQLVDETWN